MGAAKAVGDLIRTCLGPKAMLKMLMDPMGGIVMTNDGNAILREITVQNPAAKMLIEIARTQVRMTMMGQFPTMQLHKNAGCYKAMYLAFWWGIAA